MKHVRPLANPLRGIVGPTPWHMLGRHHHAILESAVEVHRPLQHALAETDLATSASSLLTSTTTAVKSEPPRGDAIILYHSRARSGT